MLKRALLLSGEPRDSRTLSRLSELLQKYDLHLEQVPESGALERLTASIQQGNEPVLIVFSSTVNRALPVARQLRTVAPFAQFLFLVDEANEQTLKRQLSLAPMIGTRWSIGDIEDEGLGRLIADSIRSAQQSLRLRTTIDRLNVQITTASHRGGSDHRKLVLSDRYLRSILDQARDAIIRTDDRLIVTSINQAAILLFGTDESKAVGSSVLGICGGEWYARISQIAAQLRSGAAPLLEEIECQGRDGSILYVEASMGLVTDELNRPLGFSIIARDITARKQSEQSARATAQRLQAVFRQASVGIAQVDLEGRFLEVNERYCQIVGRTAPELLDLHMQDITAPEYLSENLDLFHKLRQNGTPFTIQKQYIRPDGTRVWVDNDVSAVTDSSGRVVSIVSITVDISDRLRAEADQREIAKQREQLLESERAARAAAERASQMKDEFLATLSHELRTPLNAILGWSQVIKMGMDRKEDIAQGVEVIERNARSQAQIIEDLLDMSRIISGKIRLDVQRLDLAAVVQAAIETALPTAATKGIRLISVLDPLLGLSVSADANRLQQVLWNLLTNAIKFTPKGGKIQVVLERVNSHVEISVIDNGEGIKPEFLPHVFDRFRQEDASTTRRYGGLGLGLSIVKQLVELHGGSVRVKSGGQGKGTTFTVALPLTVVHFDPDEPERQHPRVTSKEASKLDACAKIEGLSVLVVDDEPDARALVRRLLEDCGATAMTAGSASEAVELLRMQKFDVIVSDIGMPNEDGYALIRRIRAMGPDQGGDIPAIALTAYARSEDRIKAISAGFLMHVAKPVEPLELITMVAAATGRT